MIVAQINIDLDKCQEPLLCAKCMAICPQAVFSTKATKAHKFRETEHNEYILQAVYAPACVGCNDCIKVCPKGAIAIDFKEVCVKGACANE
ncbi:MAG: 4Fe-4S dicluster domain-containing protein [Bacillota bacterium]